jgi:hypothetical protein
MKTSVYKLSHGVFVAELAGRQVMRGSIDDLAAADHAITPHTTTMAPDLTG